MFGQNNPIHGQIPQPSLPGVTPEMQMVAQQQAKPRGGMFAGASIDLGRALAGYLAGIGNPAGVQALQAMNEQRQRLLEHQQGLGDYNRKRADENSDWQTHYQYEVDHPKPINNDTANDYEFWQQKLSPDQFQQWLENRINPPQYMNVPGVGLVQVPRQAPSQVPDKPIGKLTPLGAGGPSLGGSGGFL